MPEAVATLCPRLRVKIVWDSVKDLILATFEDFFLEHKVQPVFVCLIRG